ncbi:hypothetical protein MORE_23190 [Moorella thermoacetica]|nr:hypothetical protein MTJW_19700 [Moorella thermoacetica]OIQ53075.1 hypothetical protein MORE_23190 [Moorella thermoacetica]
MTDLTRSYQVAIPPTPRILIEEGDTGCPYHPLLKP